MRASLEQRVVRGVSAEREREYADGRDCGDDGEFAEVVREYAFGDVRPDDAEPVFEECVRPCT